VATINIIHFISSASKMPPAVPKLEISLSFGREKAKRRTIIINIYAKENL
jgi:hypothetical protein